MKKLLKFLPVAMLIITLTVVFALPSGATLSNVNAMSLSNENDNRTTLLMLGDSIAAGFESPTTFLNSYGRIVAERQGWNYVNEAVNGARTYGRTNVDLYNLLTEETDRSLRVQQAIKDADVINISIGGNDLTNTDNLLIGVALAAAMAGEMAPLISYVETQLMPRISAIIRRINELNSDASISLLRNAVPMFSIFGDSNVPGFVPAVPGNVLGPIGLFAIDTLIAAYDTYLTQNPNAFFLINARDTFDQTDFVAYWVDPIHPNAAGHAKLAQTMLVDLLNHFLNNDSGAGNGNNDINNDLQNENDDLRNEIDYLRRRLNANTGMGAGTILAIIFGVFGTFFIGTTIFLIVKNKRA